MTLARELHRPCVVLLLAAFENVKYSWYENEIQNKWYAHVLYESYDNMCHLQNVHLHIFLLTFQGLGRF